MRCFNDFLASKQCHADVCCRRHDYENFLALLLLPQGGRSAAVAIRAFNVEVAQVGGGQNFLFNADNENRNKLIGNIVRV